MPEPLKNRFGADIPRSIARMIRPVMPEFRAESFISDALDGYEPLNLMERGLYIATALRRHLPNAFPDAIAILLASLGPKLERCEGFGMAPFLYLPHVLFVREYGIGHFEESMRAQYELTQRFSAEFSIRRFLEESPKETLERLRLWATDLSPHVRRLVSEGTRPRLPWAQRLRALQDDPRPVLELLELLKDDPELYVRRSVANNLNDIGKDHPALLVRTVRRWQKNATPERRWLISHALRSALRRSDGSALVLGGFGEKPRIAVRKARVAPNEILKGGAVTVSFELVNTTDRPQRLLICLSVHFRKARGGTAPKIFKLRAADLPPRQTLELQRRISLADMTTRKHYPGVHKIDLLLNGRRRYLGQFTIQRP